MIYNIYYLRANQVNFDRLIALALRLEILTQHTDEETGAVHTSCPQGAYDYIGPIANPTVEGEAITYKLDANGDVLIHANLALSYSLNDVGLAIAASDAETAAVFTALQEYFVTDPVTNRAAAPAAPARIFMPEPPPWAAPEEPAPEEPGV